MRHEFPILAQTIHGQPLTYLDNAASTQKPLAVIEAMDHCYRHEYSNIHRGVHTLSQRLSARYDTVREKAARFLNAARPEEIVFTKSTTEGLNLLASSLGELVLKPGDKILLTALEHHANIVPWQRACQRFGADLVVVPIDDDGALDTTNLDDLLDAMPPYQSGGDMILSVSFERTLYAAPPAKFEAGTPPIVEAIGLGAALDWINDKGVARLGAYEETLRAAAEQALSELPGLRLIGTAPHKAAVISFTLDGIHPHDAGTVLDQHGVAVRVGQHCAEPVMRRFGVPATIRASFAAYNDHDDIARLVAAVRATQELFA